MPIKSFHLKILLFLMLGFGALSTTSAEDASLPIRVTLMNDGKSPVEIFWVEDMGSAPEAMDLIIDPDYEAEISGEVGSTFVVAVERQNQDDQVIPFYQFQLVDLKHAPAIRILDPSYFQPVKVTVINPLKVSVQVYVPSLEENGDPIVLGNVAANSQADFEGYIDEVIAAKAEDDSIVATYVISKAAAQQFDLSTFLSPQGSTVPVTVRNYSADVVVIMEHSARAVVRAAVIDPSSEQVIDTIKGSELKLFAGASSENETLLGTHLVTDALDQVVEISLPEAEKTAGEKIAIQPSPKPTEVETIAKIKKTRLQLAATGGTMFQLINNSSNPVFYGFLDDPDKTGLWKIEGNEQGMMMTKLNSRMIIYDGGIPLDQQTKEDYFRIIDVKEDMPAIITVESPDAVKLDITNRTCKPLELSYIHPDGSEKALSKMTPFLADTVTVDAKSNWTIIARAGAESILAGQELWRTTPSRDARQSIEVQRKKTNTLDPLLVSKTSPDDTVRRTVRISNSTSRALKMFGVDETGREIYLDDTLIGSGKTVTYNLLPGKVVIFRRPNVGGKAGESGRFRVTKEPNQDVDVGSLSRRDTLFRGWTDKKRQSLVPPNEYAQNFMTLVAGKEQQIRGSMNVGDSFNPDAALLEGCASDDEAFGYWYPATSGFACVVGPRKDTSGKERKGWGEFYARLAADGGSLQIKRQYCGGVSDSASRWYPIPKHYDDMDASNEAMQTGYYELKWAPPNFLWLGGGYDIVSVDPMHYGDSNIMKPAKIFKFNYEDMGTEAEEDQSKKIFGVRSLPGRASDCKGETEFIRRMKDYNSSFLQDIGGSVSVPGIAAFSASKSFERMNTASTGSERLFLLDKCTELRHRLVMDTRWPDDGGVDFLRQPLSQRFRKAVADLPKRMDTRAYANMIQNFGTHYSENVGYGGTFFAETEVTKDTYENSTKTKRGLSIEAQGTIKKVQLGGTYSQEKSDGRSENNKHENAHYTKWATGGTNGGAGIYELWAPTIDDAPAPVDISYRALVDILTPVFFPDDPDIGAKNLLLRRATEEHIKTHSNPDRTRPGLDIRSPRRVCFKLEKMKFISIHDPGDQLELKMDLAIGILDKDGNRSKVFPDYAVRKTIEITPREGDVYISDIDAESWDKSKAIFTKFCTYPESTADELWNGSIYLWGTFHETDTYENLAKKIDRHDPENTLSLRGLEIKKENGLEIAIEKKLGPITIILKDGDTLSYTLVAWRALLP